MDLFLKSPTETLYYQIQNYPLRIGEKDLAHIFGRVRFDPRLMEVATEFIRDFWWNLNAKTLNRQMKASTFPFAIKPAILALLENCEYPSKEIRFQFMDWCQLVIRGIKNPEPQLFYVGLNKIGSKSMQREVDESISCFTKHNLLAKDIPFNKGKPGSVKMKEDLIPTRINYSDSLKSGLALEIKKIKEKGNLTNQQMIDRLGINRVFLSHILNNKLEGITVDYLLKKSELAKRVLHVTSVP